MVDKEDKSLPNEAKGLLIEKEISLEEELSEEETASLIKQADDFLKTSKKILSAKKDH